MGYRGATPEPFSTRPTYHFSVDDVFGCLIDASDHYADVFDQPVFRLLKRLYERYGVFTDLYLFREGVVNGRRRTLAEVSARFRPAFQNAEWLRFGPHALDYDVPPYSQTPAAQQQTFEAIYRQIDRFAGPDKTSRWNRLHFFSECYELTPYFRARGSDVLLLTDKPAASYRLAEGQRRRLQNEGRLCVDGLHLLRSHYRFEFFERDRTSEVDIEALLSKTLYDRGYVSVFTHEVDLHRETVRTIAEQALQFVASVAQPADVAPVEPTVLAWRYPEVPATPNVRAVAGRRGRTL
ncbi:MAG TPA: hypothetical protein VFX05_18605 [Casimicrobiaceae bacterium]|nr:hypothetical protein [Casimicrobiaceae bacterium]